MKDWADRQSDIRRFNGEWSRMDRLFPQHAWLVGPLFIGSGIAINAAGEQHGPLFITTGAAWMGVKLTRRIAHRLFDKNHRAIVRDGKAALNQNRPPELIAYGGRLVNRSQLKALRKADQQQRNYHA